MKLPRDAKGRRTHNIFVVYGEMLAQCCADYSSLPDPRSLTQTEIRFFYDHLRPTLKKHSEKK